MCLIMGPICDLLGRKVASILTAIPFIIGWILVIQAPSLATVYTGRFMTGLSMGAFCISCPVYTSEIAEKEIRGVVGTFFQLFLTIGILYAQITGYFLSIKQHSIACAVLPVVFVVVFIMQPESPTYYVKKGKLEKAGKALKRVRPEGYDVDNEIREIKASADAQAAASVTLFSALKSKATKKALFIEWGLMFCQQLCGVNAVVFYTSDIFKSCGLKMDPRIATIMVGCFQVLATFLSTVLVEKLGRKVLLLISDIGMVGCLVIVGIFIAGIERKFMSKETLNSWGWLPIAAVCIYIAVFSIGLGPIPWLLSGELFAPEVKSVCAGSVGFISWGLAFVISKTYLDLKTAIGGDTTFFIFAAFTVAGAVFIVMFVIETKGKTLDEIQQILAS